MYQIAISLRIYTFCSTKQQFILLWNYFIKIQFKIYYDIYNLIYPMQGITR